MCQLVTIVCSGENALALEDDKLAAKLSEEGWKAPDTDGSVPPDAKEKTTRYLPAIDPVAEVNGAAHAAPRDSIAACCWW